jgi:DNA-directed RNA polymerase specialized sigma24 family protein
VQGNPQEIPHLPLSIPTISDTRPRRTSDSGLGCVGTSAVSWESALKKLYGSGLANPMNRLDSNRALVVGLGRLFAADRSLTLAIIRTLAAEQWKAIASGEVFNELIRCGQRISSGMLRRCPQALNSSEDVAQEVLARVVEKDWLKGFTLDKGSPDAYLGGVLKHQTRDVVRSSGRYKHRRTAVAHGCLAEPSVADVLNAVENADMIEHIKVIAASLPSLVRDAIFRRFSALTAREVESDASIPGDNILVKRGLEMIRRRLQIE